MATKEKLEIALKEALKAGDNVKKQSVRMALAAIKQAEVDRQVVLDEPAIISILQKEVRTRKETLEEAHKANRPDIIADVEAEIKVVEAFLPQAMSAEELQVLAKEAIAEAGASSPADMGKVMKVLMPRVAGRAAGDQVSAAVRQLLQK
jgi:hypothetical protein